MHCATFQITRQKAILQPFRFFNLVQEFFIISSQRYVLHLQVRGRHIPQKLAEVRLQVRTVKGIAIVGIYRIS